MATWNVKVDLRNFKRQIVKSVTYQVFGNTLSDAAGAANAQAKWWNDSLYPEVNPANVKPFNCCAVGPTVVTGRSNAELAALAALEAVRSRG